MTTFMQRSVRRFLTIKAVREIKGEIEKAGLDNLKTLAEAGRSIIGTYLTGCAPDEQERIRRDLNALLQVGVTPEMVITELLRQMPELAPIIDGDENYKKSEVEKILGFVIDKQPK